MDREPQHTSVWGARRLTAAGYGKNCQPKHEGGGVSNHAPNFAWSCPGYLARGMTRILRVSSGRNWRGAAEFVQLCFLGRGWLVPQEATSSHLVPSQIICG